MVDYEALEDLISEELVSSVLSRVLILINSIPAVLEGPK